MRLLFLPLDPLTTPPWLIRETWIMFLVRENVSAHWPFYSICLCLRAEGIAVAGTTSNLHVGDMAWLSPTQIRNSLLTLSWSDDWASETEGDQAEILSHLLPSISRVSTHSSSIGDPGSIHSCFPNHINIGLKGTWVTKSHSLLLQASESLLLLPS